MEPRTIFHVDLDAFFASVEIVRNPALKGKPLIVGGRVVSTCSYEAREFGVHSAMSMFEAQRKCPHAILIQGNYSLYQEYSNRVMEIFLNLTHRVEIVGIDEAYIEVTDLPTPHKQIGQMLRKQVFEQTQLTCSVGIASNKLVAKIASSGAKPNGLYEIPFGKEAKFLSRLPIGKIPGIGPKTQEVFFKEGINTVGDLQQLTLDQLLFRYGQRGYHYYHLVHGKDNRPVFWEDEAPKQVGAETTFDANLSDRCAILEELDGVLEKAFRRLTRENMLTRGLSLKLRDSEFHTITRSMTFPTHTKDYQTLRESAHELFDNSWTEDETLRLIGVAFEKLTDGYWQPLLWEWEGEG